MSKRSKTALPVASTSLWPATANDFLQSLGASQRRWFEQREVAREQALQQAFTTLSRGLAPVVAVHGELLEQRLHTTALDGAGPRIPLTTLQAYLATRYVVDVPKTKPKTRRSSGTGAKIELHIGRRSTALAALHAVQGVAESVFVTAYNPFGQAQDEADNRIANDTLRDWLAERGFLALPGRGTGDDPDWAPEESVLVLGADAHLARALCITFRQNAVVHIGADAVPTLVLHPDAVLE